MLGDIFSSSVFRFGQLARLNENIVDRVKHFHHTFQSFFFLGLLLLSPLETSFHVSKSRKTAIKKKQLLNYSAVE